ncbi:CDP-diacylglycerol--glycerol-3-phosphate 3-phosphatidyltransferase [Ezakiella peruensis]|uniref:CDP-diacylglycerol--glycerol-3-phosphate 3-phosphatidyltransferase n=1 Tax=Ezakiella peruensis TaxID=1464038 RepID=UPI000C1AFFD1|nr:CDP-diacylglycerol--glycerol-3-phosphate 3-phosphatidyltransferase [Ezakiella peruensis]
MNLPNKITIARMFLVPVLIALYYLHPNTYAPAIIFIIASLTDMLDGYLARKNNQITAFGKFIDPLADKILAITALILFVESKILPAVPVIIVIYREFAVSGFRLVAANKGITIAAGKTGKIKTALQFIGIAMILISMGGNFNQLLNIGVITIYLSVVMTVVSFIIYIKENIEVLK